MSVLILWQNIFPDLGTAVCALYTLLLTGLLQTWLSKPAIPLLISCLDDLSIIENGELSSSNILYIFLSISSLQF